MSDTPNSTSAGQDAAKKGQDGYGQPPHNPAPPKSGPQSNEPKK